jgi:hypothetical protein
MTTMMRLAAFAMLGVLLRANAMASPSAQLVVEAGDAQALTLAADGLRHDLERIARGPHSTLSVRLCRDEETAVRAVAADLSAVAAAKRQIRSVAARIVTTPGRTWLAARDFNSARDADLRGAVLEARSIVQVLADDPHDETAAGSPFEMLAMRLDASMTWLRRDATFPVLASPSGGPAVSPQAADALRHEAPGLPALRRRD